MTTSLVLKCVKFLKSGELYSDNDAYNQSVYGFRKEQLKKVDKAMYNLYGNKFNWPKQVNAVNILKNINEAI